MKEKKEILLVLYSMKDYQKDCCLYEKNIEDEKKIIWKERKKHG